MTRQKNKTIGTSIKVDAQLHSAIAQAAKVRGVSASELIRDVVAASLGVCPTCGTRTGSFSKGHKVSADAAA